MPIDIRDFNKIASENAKEQKRKEAGGLKTPTEVLSEVGFDPNIDSGTTYNEQTNELHRLGFSGLIESGRDYSDQLAMRQSDSEKWGNSAIKFGKGVLGGIIDNIASWDLKGLYDMGAGNTNEKYGNWLNESEFGKWLKDETGLEVYTNGDDFGSSGYWAKMFGNMGYTVGIMLETLGEQAVLAMLTGGAGNVAALGSKVNLIKNVVLTGHGAFSGIREAYMNALETQANTYNKFKQMGFDEEYSQKKANEAASLGFKVEAGPVALLNSLQAMSIWGKFGKPFERGGASFGISDNFQNLAEKAFGNKIKNKFAQKALDYGLNSASEAVEEGFQTAVGQYATAETTGENYDFWNEEMRDSMLMGAISGGLMKGMGELFSSRVDNQIRKSWLQRQDKFVEDTAKEASENFSRRSAIVQQIQELEKNPSRSNRKEIQKLQNELKTLAQDLSYSLTAKALQMDYYNGRGTVAYDAHIENMQDILQDLNSNNTEALQKRQILDENGNFQNGWTRETMIEELQNNIRNAEAMKNKITTALQENTSDFDEAYKIATKSINLDNRLNASTEISRGVNESLNKSNEFQSLSTEAQNRFRLEAEQQALLNLQSRGTLGITAQARLEEINKSLSELPEYSATDKQKINAYSSMLEDLISANEVLHENNNAIDKNTIELAESKKEENIRKNIEKREKQRAEEARSLAELENIVNEVQNNNNIDDKSKQNIIEKAEERKQDVAAEEHINQTRAELPDAIEVFPDNSSKSSIQEGVIEPTKDEQYLLDNEDLLNQLFGNDDFEANSRRNFEVGKNKGDAFIELKDSLERTLGALKEKLGKEPTFKDLMEHMINISSRERASKAFDAYANLYKSTGRRINEDLQNIHDYLFNSANYLADNILEVYEEVEDKIEENTQVIEQVVQDNQPIVEIPIGENTIPIRDNNTIDEDNRTSLTTAKAALLGLEYVDVFEGDKVVRRNKTISLNESKEIGNHFVLDYDDINVGSELEVEIPDNYLDISVSNWVRLSNGQLLNKPLPFKDYLQLMKEQGNDVSENSPIFRNKVPMVAKNKNGNIFMLHDTEWYNENNISNRENNQKDIIKKAQAELKGIRQTILDNRNNNKTTKIEVTGRTFGSFANRNESNNLSEKQPVTLSKATGQTTLVIAGKDNVLYGNINPNNKLLNKLDKSPFTAGALYELREVNRGEYIALRAITNDVTKGEDLNHTAVNNMKWVLLAYLYLNSNNEVKDYLRNKYGITDSKAVNIEKAIKDTAGNFDISSYFKMYVAVLPAKELNRVLDDNTGRYPVGQTYISIDNGGAIKIINKTGEKLQFKEKDGKRYDTLPKIEVNRLRIQDFVYKSQDGRKIFRGNIDILLDNIFGENGLSKAVFNPSKELIGKNTRFIAFTEEGDVQEFTGSNGGNTYEDYIKDNVKSNVQSFKITDKDGNEKWVTDVQPTITYRIKSEESTPQVLEEAEQKVEDKKEEEKTTVENGGQISDVDTKLRESIARLDKYLEEGKISQEQYDNTVLALKNQRYNGFYNPEEANSRRNFDVDEITKLSSIATNQIDGITIIEQDQLTDSLFYQTLKDIKINGNYVSLREIAVALQEAPEKFLQPLIDSNNELIELYKSIDGMENSIDAINRMNTKYKNILTQKDKLISKGDESTAKGSLFIKMEQFFAEELENIDLQENDNLEQNENGEVETNYSQSSLERDVKVSFSNRLKMFFAGIEDKNSKGQQRKNLLGLPTYVNPDTAIGMLRDITTKIDSSEKDLLDALRSKQNNPTYKELLHKLEANQDSQVMNEILYKLIQAKLKMYMIYVSPGKLEMLNANNRDGIIRALNTWKNEFKNSSVFMIQDGEYVYNKEYLENVRYEIQTLKNQSGVIKVEQLKSIFKLLGLNIEDNVLEKAVNDLQTDKDNLFKKPQGLLDKLVYSINDGVLNTLDNTGKKKNKVFAEDFDFINSTADVFKNTLAPYQVELNGSAIEKSFRVAGKTIQEAVQRNMSFDTLKSLKDPNSKLFQALETIPYSKRNYVLNLIKNNADVQNRLEVAFTSLEAIKQKGAKSKDKMGINELSESDYILTELGFFQNSEKQLGNNNEYGLYFRLSKAFTPTLSDKSQMLVVSTPLLDLREADFTAIDKNYTKVSDRVIDFMLSQLFDGEFDRIIQSYNKDFNIKSYNKAAKRFLGIPGFNKLTIDFKGQQVNIHRVLSKVYNDPNKVEHYRELFRKEAAKFLHKLIDFEAKNKININSKNGEWIKANLYNTKTNTINGLDNLYFNNKKVGGLSDERKIILLSYDKVINDLLSQNNIYQLFAGDMALYAPGTSKFEIKNNESKVIDFDDVGFTKKTGENITKRMAMLIAPGSKLANTFDNNGNPEMYYQLMVNDPVTITSMAEALITQHYGSVSEANKEALNELREAENKLQEVYEKRYSLNSFEDSLKEVVDRIDEAKSKLKKLNKSISGYFDIEGTDAQEYTTWQEHMDILWRQGRLSVEQRRLYKSAYNKLSNGEELDSRELSLVMNPIKPIYSGSNIVRDGDGNAEINRVTYIKSSSFPLLPQLTKGLKIDKIRQQMESLQENSGKKVRLSYQTANKVGAANTKLTVDDLYNLSAEELSKTNFKDGLLELDRNNFRIQQDTPYKTDKYLHKNQDDHIIMGSQMWKIILGGGINQMENKIFPNKFDENLLEEINNTLSENNKIVPDENNNISGKDLDKIKFYVENKYSKIVKEALYKELGMTPNGSYIDRNKLIENVFKVLQREATTRDYPQSVLDGLRLYEENGNLDFNIPLWLSPGTQKFESLLQAIVTNRLIRLHLPGGSHYSTSSEGFQKTEIVGDDKADLSKVVWVDKNHSGELKATYVTNEDGKKVLKESEILIQSKFRITTEENGKKVTKLIDLTKEPYSTFNHTTGRLELNEDMIDKELLSSFSYRIPTSSLQSGAILKVVGFIPEGNGDTIVVPKEHTKQIGEDFDIDKRNVYKENYVVDNNDRISLLTRENSGLLANDTVEETIKSLKEEINSLRQENKSLFNRLDELDDLSEENEVELVKFILGENNNFSNKEQREIIKNLKLNKQEKAALYQELKEAKQSLLSKKKAEDIEKKLLENAMIQVYKSVYSTTDNSIQKRINTILSFDVASDTANEINKKIKGNTDEQFFTTLSSTYQREQMKLGASGKLGIGVHSNAVTLQAQFERLFGTKNELSITTFDEDGNPINKVIKLGELKSDGRLGNTNTIDGERTIGDVNAENQNSATDNVKAQIMGKRNENAYTINVLTLMTLRGFDMTLNPITLSNGKKTKLQYSSLLISQPIIRRYVELKEQQKSLTADSNSFDEQELIEQLIKEFNVGNVSIKRRDNGSINKLDFLNSVSNNNYTALTGQALYDNLDTSKSSNVQLQALQAFFMLEEESKQVNEIQKLISLNTTGLGVSYFNVLDRINALDNIATSNIKNATKLIGRFFTEDIYNDLKSQNENLVKDFTKIGNYYWKPETTEGITLINSLSVANNLMQEFFPYKSNNINEIVNRIVGDKKDASNQLRYEIMSNLRDFMYTANLGLFRGDITAERKRLFFDIEDNQSLASFINSVKNEGVAKTYFKNNQFLKNLDTIIDRTGKPSLIDSGIDNDINFSKSNRYADFLKLLYDDEIILGTWNGEQITPRKLAQDLATYAFLSNDEGGSIGFRNFVNQNYLDIVGVSKELRNYSENLINNFNPEQVDNFVKQFMQHNPQYAKRLDKNFKTSENVKILREGSNGKVLDFSMRVETLDKYYALRNKDSYDLYEYNEYTDSFMLIPTLGSFGYNEFNFNEDVDKTLLPDNNIYPQELSKSEKHNYKEPNNNVVVSPKIITFADEFDMSKGLKSLLIDVVSRSTDSKHKRFLDKLLPYLDQNTKVIMVDYIGNSSTDDRQGMTYDPNTNTIKISKNVIQYVEGKYKNNNESVESIISEMLLEEFIHSITINELGKYGTYDSSGSLIPNQNAPVFVHKIIKLYEEAKKSLPKDSVDNVYYTKNIREFIAGVFVSNEFRNKLDNTEVGDKSLLDKFKEVIRDLLRYVTGATYTDEAINSVMEMLNYRENSKKVTPTNNYVSNQNIEDIVLSWVKETSLSLNDIIARLKNQKLIEINC